MMLRMSEQEEWELFCKKCKKEKVEPRLDTFAVWQDKVRERQAMIYAYTQTEDYKSQEAERIRRQQRTVDQTIREDGAIVSPIDEQHYTTKRSWEDHKKANDVVEVGNETSKKRKQNKTLKNINSSLIIN